MKKYQIILWVFLIFYQTSNFAQQVFPGGGSGSYNLTLPPDDYQAGNTYDEIGGGAAGYAFTTMGPNYTGPFQTHQWWTSALWNVGLGAGTSGEVWYRGDSHSENMHPLPFQIEAIPEGFDLRYRDNANQVSAANQVNNGPATIDLRVGLSGSAATETSVDGYGDFHAIFRQEWAGTTLLATASSGSPYFFLERQGNQDFDFYHQGAPGTINDVLITPTMEGISLTTNTGPTSVTFGILFPPGTSLDGTAVSALATGGAPFGSTFTADVPNGSNYITIMVLPDNSPATFQDFAQYGWNFITNTTHSFSYDESNSLLTTEFDITTNNVYGQPNTGTMQSMYRHQWLYSPEMSGGNATTYVYPSVRGNMKVVRSSTFTTEMTHMGILPSLGWANTADQTTLNNYVNNFAAALNPMPDVADGYNKDQFNELLTAVQIADQIGNTAAFNIIIGHMRDRLEDWLVADDGDYDRYFAYDPNFNWMAHYPNGFGSSGTFVDAHFHVGYFMMTAAILARYDPAFVANYQDLIDAMIGSINEYRKNTTDPGASGTTSPWFPYLRYFDPYAGHSWADPMANDQESVSEAIHFAAGVFLWGETTQNDPLRDLGALLFTTETEAARQYWFDVDAAVNGAPYANAYNHQHLTMLYNWGGNYATFFGTNPEYIHGITYVPGSGASTWLGTNINGAATDYAQIGGDYSSWGGWGQAINVQHATHDPTSAINAFNSFSGGWGSNSLPFTYHWIHTYDSVGLYDGANVQADISGFGTFVKDSCNTWYRHYMFYNPPGDPVKTVHATDGTCWHLPEDTVITYALLGPDTIGNLNASTTTICNGATVDLTLTNYSVCDNDTVVEYQVSTDGTNWTTVQRLSGGSANQITVTPPGTGTVYYRAVMINEYPTKPEMLCDLNDTMEVAEQVTITINPCGCTSPTTANLMPIGLINLCAPATQNISVTTDAPAGYEYTWYEVTGPANMNSGPVVDDDNYTVTSTGAYFVVIADPSDPATCFLNSDTINVNISPATTPSVTITEDQNNICPGTLVTFTVTDSTNGGSDPTFAWDINGTTIVGDQNQFSTDTLTNGSTVSVTMTSNDVCTSPTTASDNVVMNITSSVTPSVTITEDQNNICPGTLVTFTVTDSTNGGSDPTFAWGINGTTIVGDQNQFSTDTLTNGSTVSVTMTSNDVCASPITASDNVVMNITSSVTPSVTITEDQNNICPGTLVTFTVIDSTNGGTNPTFAWDINGTTVVGDQNQFSTDTLTNGSTISVSMTSNDACASPITASDNVIMAVVPSFTPTFNGSSSPTTCSGNDGEINISGLGNGLPYDIDYNFNGNPTIISLSSDGDGNITISGLQSGTYDNFLLTYSSCPNTLTGGITLSDPGSPTFSISTSTNPAICNGSDGSISLSGLNSSQNYDLIYSFNGVPTSTIPITSDATGNFQISGLSAGDYNNFQITQMSCSSTDPTIINLSDPTSPSVNIASGANPTDCGLSDGQIIITTLNSSTAYTFSYDFNGVATSTQTINSNVSGEFYMTGLGAGIYTNFSFSQAGCTTIDPTNVVLSQPTTLIPTVSIEVNQNNICKGSELQFSITSINNAGTAPNYSWLVNGIEQGTNIEFATTNLHNSDQVSLQITSSETCANPMTAISNTISIIMDPCLPVVVPNAFTPNNDGSNDVWEIQGLDGYSNITLEVFNRWGSLVYKTTGNYQPWNGKRLGKGMPVATYYYILKYGVEQNTITGTVTLVY